MEILCKIGAVILLSVLSGILGRLGGRERDGAWYDFASKSWVRDWLCPLTALMSLWLLVGFDFSCWWAYLLIYGLMGGALSTYWDELFGEDNLLFSGFIVGMSVFPLFWCEVILPAITVRALLLAIIWGLLDKYMPKKLFIWRGDIANEFIRYFSISLTMIVLYFVR